MKIKIPKVIRQIYLAEHAQEYGNTEICVWVNPGEDEIARFETIRLEILSAGEAIGHAEGDNLKSLAERIAAANQKLNEWYAHVWSQGPDASTHWTAEEVHELAVSALEHDPALWQFVQEKTFVLIGEYRGGGYLKKFRTTSSTSQPRAGSEAR